MDKGRNKKNYKGGAKNWYTVDPTKGVKGVLVTCDPGRERQCIQEMLLWMTEVERKAEPIELGLDSKSVGSLLDDELKELQQEATRERLGRMGSKKRGRSEAELEVDVDDTSGNSENKQGAQRKAKRAKLQSDDRFESLDLGAQSAVFIQIKDAAIDPHSLIKTMLKEVRDKKELHTRFSIRLQPINNTCFSRLEDLEKAAKIAIDAAFETLPEPKTTYAVEFRRRGKNKNLERMATIEMLAKLVPDDCRVDLHDPDVLLCVDSITRWTGFSVVTEFAQLKKFNVRSLSDVNAAKEAKTLTAEPSAVDAAAAAAAPADAAPADAAPAAAPADAGTTPAPSISATCGSVSPDAVAAPDTSVSVSMAIGSDESSSAVPSAISP